MAQWFCILRWPKEHQMLLKELLKHTDYSLPPVDKERALLNKPDPALGWSLATVYCVV